MSKIVSVMGILSLGALIFGVLVALPIMLLWNWLCPELFGLPSISFWQAIGLYFLVSCLTWQVKTTNK